MMLAQNKQALIDINIENSDEILLHSSLNTTWFHAKTGEFVLWISFGASNNFTDLFWKAVKRGLRVWDKTLSSQLAKLTFPDNNQSLHLFMELLNGAAQRSGKIIMVFDGVQYLKDGPVKKMVTNCVNTATNHVATIMLEEENTVIVGRLDAAKSLKQIGQLLQFTPEEIQVYYTALGIVLDKRSLNQIWSITEGWSAAVVLLGKCLQRDVMLNDSIIDIAVTGVNEILEKELLVLEETVQRSIVLLSLLNNFTTEMVTELTFLSADQFDTFKHNTPFFLLHRDGTMYYFHRMYHQFLKNNQIHLTQQEKLEFLCKAARWCDDHDFYFDAITYYVACEAYNKLLPTVRRAGALLIESGNAARVADILTKVPDVYMLEHPQLQIYLLMTLTYCGRQNEAILLAQEMQQNLEGKNRTDADDRILGEFYLASAYQYWQISSEQYITYLKRAAELLPEGTQYLSYTNIFSPGGSLLRFGQMESGNLLRILDFLLEAIHQKRKLLGRVGVSKCYWAASEAHMYRMEFDEAREYAGNAIVEAGFARQWDIICETDYVLMRISMDCGELDDVLFYRDRILFHAEKLSATQAHSILIISQMHLYIYMDLYHLLDEQMRQDPLKDPFYIKPNSGREFYAYAAYLAIVERKYRPALNYIDNAIPVCQENGMWFAKLKLLLLKSVVHALLQEKAMSVKYFLLTYQMTSENAITFPFVELGEHIMELIHSVRAEIAESTIPSLWFDEIKAACENYNVNKKRLSKEFVRRFPHLSMNRIGQLSEKEFTALKYACEGNSTQQIATRMGVQVATVHSYLHRAYKKMGVKDKEEAVEKAIVEGILD